MKAAVQQSELWSDVPVLVTGGAGFIGGHLVRGLLEAGACVRVLDDGSSGAIETIPPAVRFFRASVEDAAAVAEAVDGVRAVFHLAAMVSVPACQAEPQRCHAVNVRGSEIVARAARDVGAAVTFASSCAVYGSASPPIVESAPTKPKSAYAQSKLDAEACIEHLAEEGLCSTRLRLFNVIGPGQRSDTAYAAVGAAFARSMIEGAPLCIEGDGRQTRDFVPVDLVIDVMLRLGLQPANSTVNVGTGHPCDLIALIAMFEAASGRDAEVVHVAARPGDIRHSWANIDRLRSLLSDDLWSSDRITLEPVIASLLEQYSGSADAKQICT